MQKNRSLVTEIAEIAVDHQSKRSKGNTTEADLLMIEIGEAIYDIANKPDYRKILQHAKDGSSDDLVPGENGCTNNPNVPKLHDNTLDNEYLVGNYEKCSKLIKEMFVLCGIKPFDEHEMRELLDEERGMIVEKFITLNYVGQNHQGNNTHVECRDESLFDRTLHYMSKVIGLTAAKKAPFVDAFPGKGDAKMGGADIHAALGAEFLSLLKCLQLLRFYTILLWRPIDLYITAGGAARE